MKEKVTLIASDGRKLSARLFVPEASDPTAPAVVIHPATAVHKMYYKYFAEYLNNRGIPVLVYDYRGTGPSARANDRKDAKITMTDWMLLDVPAANEFMRKRYPERKLVAVGHSVGGEGQLVAQKGSPADAIVLLAAHASIINIVPSLRNRWKLNFIFNVLTPLGERTLGYVPAWRMKLNRVPVGVMKQWRRWANSRDYFFGDYDFPLEQSLDERISEINVPIFSVIFRDDPWATRRAADVLLEPVDEKLISRRNVRPIAIGAVKIGHIGFFDRVNSVAWDSVVAWLAREGRRREPAAVE